LAPSFRWISEAIGKCEVYEINMSTSEISARFTFDFVLCLVHAMALVENDIKNRKSREYERERAMNTGNIPIYKI
jgi:hypothetical protein